PSTHIYTLSLHDALPIYSFFDFHGFLPSVRRIRYWPYSFLRRGAAKLSSCSVLIQPWFQAISSGHATFNPCLSSMVWIKLDACIDRKSTRLNSSHVAISY